MRSEAYVRALDVMAPTFVPGIPGASASARYALAVRRMDRGECPLCGAKDFDEDGRCVPCREEA